MSKLDDILLKLWNYVKLSSPHCFKNSCSHKNSWKENRNKFFWSNELNSILQEQYGKIQCDRGLEE